MRTLESDNVGVKIDDWQLPHLRFDDIILITANISREERMLADFDKLGQEINMMNDLAPELSKRKRAAWGAFRSTEDAVKMTKNTRFRLHLFDSTVLPALTYASETGPLRKLRPASTIKNEDAILYAKHSKIKWARHVMRVNDNRWTRAVMDWIHQDVKRTARGRPTQWSQFFTKILKEYDGA
uniref:Reverse transcriptase domain-containing protein n=1 Tax=Angiostrongylus cantonensis TaxID=6313 RepID=A0A0K0D3Q7_ANGCA